jgi:ribonucleotide monophosphatase NagD (HAD superfamily)
LFENLKQVYITYKFYFRQRGKKIAFVTNNATKSTAQNMAKFKKLGICADEGEVICAAFSAAQYLSKNHPQVMCLV